MRDRTGAKGVIHTASTLTGFVGLMSIALRLNPSLPDGTMDAPAVAATMSAMMLAMAGVAMGLKGSMRTPRPGEGSLDRNGIVAWSLAMAVTGLALATVSVAVRPLLPTSDLGIVPAILAGVLGLSALGAMAERVIAGSTARRGATTAG